MFVDLPFCRTASTSPSPPSSGPTRRADPKQSPETKGSLRSDPTSTPHPCQIWPCCPSFKVALGSLWLYWPGPTKGRKGPFTLILFNGADTPSVPSSLPCGVLQLRPPRRHGQRHAARRHQHPEAGTRRTWQEGGGGKYCTSHSHVRDMDMLKVRFASLGPLPPLGPPRNVVPISPFRSSMPSWPQSPDQSKYTWVMTFFGGGIRPATPQRRSAEVPVYDFVGHCRLPETTANHPPRRTIPYSG